jgi:hypothetical protein
MGRGEAIWNIPYDFVSHMRIETSHKQIAKESTDKNSHSCGFLGISVT